MWTPKEKEWLIKNFDKTDEFLFAYHKRYFRGGKSKAAIKKFRQRLCLKKVRGRKATNMAETQKVIKSDLKLVETDVSFNRTVAELLIPDPTGKDIVDELEKKEEDDNK